MIVELKNNLKQEKALLLPWRPLNTTLSFCSSGSDTYKDECCTKKKWRDSKWLEGVWHRMWRETLLFLLPVSSAAVCTSVNIPLPVSLHVVTWRAHPFSGHTAELMASDFRKHNTPVKFYFMFLMLIVQRWSANQQLSKEMNHILFPQMTCVKLKSSLVLRKLTLNFSWCIVKLSMYLKKNVVYTSPKAWE